jgi:hypothetical protein
MLIRLLLYYMENTPAIKLLMQYGKAPKTLKCKAQDDNSNFARLMHSYCSTSTSIKSNQKCIYVTVDSLNPTHGSFKI